ncbi:MAG: hypothetical protein JJU00_20030, partial [Opitutales bacterium]|nr:hypothetical protein [Opitutales bacterium]
TAMYNYYECLPSDGGGADTPNPGDGPGDGSGGGGGGDDPGEVDPRTREMMRERCQRYADNIERDLGYISSASGEHALFSLMRGYLVDNEGFSLSRDGANLVQKSVSTTLGLLGLSGIDGVSAASYGWNAGDILLQFERENYREGLEKLYNTGLKTYLGAVQKRIFRSIGSRPIPGVNLVGGAVDLHGLTMDIHEIKNAKRHTDIALASKLDHIEGGIRDAHASAETWKHRYSQENCDKWLRDE